MVGAATWGCRPVTGYTGHLAEDATGLIYSPDRGADPACPNQYSYAGGRPFSATDPSGLRAQTQDMHYDWSDFLRWVAEQDRAADEFMADAMRGALERAKAMEDALKRIEEGLPVVFDASRPLNMDGLPRWLGWLNWFTYLLPPHVGVEVVVDHKGYLTETEKKDGLNKIKVAEKPVSDIKNFGDIKKLFPAYRLSSPWLVPAGFLVTDQTAYQFRDHWNALGKEYAWYNSSPDAPANNCYASRDSFYGFVRTSYDAARPRSR